MPIGTCAVTRISPLLWRVDGFEIDQNGRSMASLPCGMATIVYRCPTTGRNVQGWFDDDTPARKGETHESMTCLACKQVHLTNRLTGKVFGDEWTVSIDGLKPERLKSTSRMFEGMKARAIA